MVDGDAGGNAHPATLILRPYSYTVNWGFLILQYTNCAVFGLTAGGKCCTCGSRVCNPVCGRIGNCNGRIGELSK